MTRRETCRPQSRCCWLQARKWQHRWCNGGTGRHRQVGSDGSGSQQKLAEVSLVHQRRGSGLGTGTFRPVGIPFQDHSDSVVEKEALLFFSRRAYLFSGVGLEQSVDDSRFCGQGASRVEAVLFFRRRFAGIFIHRDNVWKIERRRR